MNMGELIAKLKFQVEFCNVSPDTPVLIDCGSDLREIEDVDLGGSDEGVIIWAGDICAENG